MANSDWLIPSQDLRGVDPQTARPERMPLAIARTRLAERERLGAGADVSGIFTATYSGPDGEGRHFVESLRDPGVLIAIPSNGGLDGFTPGQKVLVGNGRMGWTIVGNPLSGELSKQTSQPVRQVGTVDLFAISSASPNQLAPGDSEVTVTLSGYGFSESPLDTFEAVVYDSSASAWIVDAEVTLASPVFVSDTEVTVSVSVDSGASPGRFINIRVERS